MRPFAITVVLACLGCSCTLAATPPSTPDSPPSAAKPHYWEDLPDPPAFIGVAYTWDEKDESLRGVRISSGIAAEQPYKRGLVHRSDLDSWLSWNSSDEQTIWALGLGFESPYAVAWGPLRILPRGTLGLEYRTKSPDHGLGVLGGVGVVAEVWLSRHLAASVSVERRFSYPGNDSTIFGVTLRFVGERVPFLIPLA